MNTWISILRGVNVSGKNRIKMKELEAMYEDLGFKNVFTYIQSGNVVFQEKQMNTAEVEQKISEAILKKFSLQVPVLVLERKELETLLEQNPFKKELMTQAEKLHITILPEAPEKRSPEFPEKGISLHDQYFMKGRAIYLFCPDGYGRTKFNNNYFENTLKLTATTRNLRTLTELLRISDSIAG